MCCVQKQLIRSIHVHLVHNTASPVIFDVTIVKPYQTQSTQELGGLPSVLDGLEYCTTEPSMTFPDPFLVRPGNEAS